VSGHTVPESLTAEAKENSSREEGMEEVERENELYGKTKWVPSRAHKDCRS
jgi:hypothetical protein